MRMKFAAAILMFVLPVAMQAQAPDAVRPSTTFAPLPQIGFPLPSIGLPLPSIGLPRVVDTPLPRADGGFPTQRMPDQRRFGRRGNAGLGGTVVFVMPAYGWGYPVPVPVPVVAPPSPPIPTESPKPEPQLQMGRLRLDLQPRTGLQY